jgi:transposase
MRQRDDVLAQASRLAERWRVGKYPPRPSGSPWRSRQDRLVAGGGGFELCAGSFWGGEIGPNPTDKGKNGSKRHLLTDAQGVPLAVKLSGANRHDSQMALPLVKAIGPIRRARGRPRQRPQCLVADKAYDSANIRNALRHLGIRPEIPHRLTSEDRGLGRFRWVVERTLSWLSQFRRLRIRYEKRADIHQAFLTIGCALICWSFLHHAFC